MVCMKFARFQHITQHVRIVAGAPWPCCIAYTGNRNSRRPKGYKQLHLIIHHECEI